jgi:hypothetical protein
MYGDSSFAPDIDQPLNAVMFVAFGDLFMPRYGITEEQINLETDFVLTLHERNGEVYAYMRHPAETYSDVRPIEEALEIADQQTSMRPIDGKSIEVVIVDNDKLWPAHLGLLTNRPE